jgi:hypothetical protein
MSTFEDEITRATLAYRRQHEINRNSLSHLDMTLEAHHRERMGDIQAIREREAWRRLDEKRALVQLASEVGLLPAREPEPMQVQSDVSDMPAFLAKHHAAEEVDRIVN